jgi:CheY-like chemotaxis protein
MTQANTAAPVQGALASDSYAWSATALGARAGWPQALRLSVDILLNTPLPMLLAWGDDPVVVINHAYARLAGTEAPDARAGSALPAPLAGCADAFARARRGDALRLTQQLIKFAHPHGEQQLACDIHLTPVGDERGSAGGVLCALGACTVVQAAPAALAGALRILVVEDNLDSQYLVCEMLKAFGHDADGVGDGEAAFGMLKAAAYDVLFSDVSLPGISGVELARQALAMQPDMKVIFASGYGDALLRHLPFPFVSLQKPYEMEQLQTTLNQMARELGR